MLFQELDKDRKRAQLILQHIPHVVPHKNVSWPGTSAPHVASGYVSSSHSAQSVVFLTQAALC